MSDNTPNTDPTEGAVPPVPPVPPVPQAPPVPPAAPVAPGAAEAPAPETAWQPAAEARPAPETQAAPGAPYVAPAPAAPGFPAQAAPGLPAAAPYPGAPAYGQVPPASKAKGLALTSMILGIAALVCFWVPFLAPALGLVAVVLGIVALVKKQSFGFGLAGIITGSLGIIIGIFVLVAFFAALALGGDVLTGLVEQGQQVYDACMGGADYVEIDGVTVYCEDVLGNN